MQIQQSKMRKKISHFVGVSAGKTGTTWGSNPKWNVKELPFHENRDGLVSLLKRIGTGCRGIGIAVGASFVPINNIPQIDKKASGFAYLAGYSKKRLHNKWTKEIGVPVTFCHDGVAEAEAEAVLGAGRGCSRFLTLSTGTSPGVGYGINGSADEGLYSPQPSHLKFDGCEWRHLVGRDARNELAKDLGLPSPDKMENIASLVKDGHKKALEFVNEYSRRLSLGLAVGLVWFPVDRIILVGSTAIYLGQPLARALQDQLGCSHLLEGHLGSIDVQITNLRLSTALGAQLYAYRNAQKKFRKKMRFRQRNAGTGV